MKRNKLSKFRRRNERQAYLMIAPQIIGFFVFSIYPILWVFRYAFYQYDGVNEVFIGLENFIRAFTRDKNFWTSVINTFIIAYGKLIIEIPLTFIGIAWLIKAGFSATVALIRAPLVSGSKATSIS